MLAVMLGTEFVVHTGMLCQIMLYYMCFIYQLILKNSYIHEQNTMEIIAVKESLYVIKHMHVDFHKTFASIFSTYTTPIFKIVS